MWQYNKTNQPRHDAARAVRTIALRQQHCRKIRPPAKFIGDTTSARTGITKVNRFYPTLNRNYKNLGGASD